jgi:hypothetical protein
LHIWIAKSAIDIVIGFIGKSSAHTFGVIKTKAARQKKWTAMFHFICLRGSNSYGVCLRL